MSDATSLIHRHTDKDKALTTSGYDTDLVSRFVSNQIHNEDKTCSLFDVLDQTIRRPRFGGFAREETQNLLEGLFIISGLGSP